MYFFPYIGNVIIPTDQLIFFRGAEITNQDSDVVDSINYNNLTATSLRYAVRIGELSQHGLNVLNSCL